MLQTTVQVLTALLLATTCVAHPAPIPTAAPAPHEVEEAFKEREIEKRAATCTFSGSLGYSSASVSKASCSTIILDALTVPAGKTLDRKQRLSFLSLRPCAGKRIPICSKQVSTGSAVRF